MLRTTSTHRIFSASNSFIRKHAPPADLLKLNANTEARTFETRRSFQKGTRRTHCNQKLKGRTPTGPLKPPRPAALPFRLIVSSHHIPLLSCHGPSTVRGEHSCRDSLGSITPPPGLMHFLAQHVQGHAAAQGHLRQLPILPGKRRYCHQAHTTQ